MANNNTIYYMLGGIALLLFVANRSGAASLPDGATFDLTQLNDTYGADNVQRLTNLYAALAQTTDPNTGQPLTASQMQLLLSQALFESGLFTGSANYNLVDNFHNYTGIKGNSRYAAAPGSQYVAYPSLSAYVNDWLTILSFGTPPLEANGVYDFAQRLKNNGYYTDTLANYTNGLNAYYNILNGIAT